MTAIIARQITFKQGLSARDKVVYLNLSSYTNKENSCFPAIKTLANLCHMSVSTIKRALNALVEAGFIKKTARFRKDNSQTSNLYELAQPGDVFPKPEKAKATVKTPPSDEAMEVATDERKDAVVESPAPGIVQEQAASIFSSSVKAVGNPQRRGFIRSLLEKTGICKPFIRTIELPPVHR